jgi:hypothetical protein
VYLAPGLIPLAIYLVFPIKCNQQCLCTIAMFFKG